MFQPIGKVLELKPQATGITRSIQAAVILAKINEVASGRWEAVRYQKKRLTLVAPSPTQAQEIVLRRQQILEEINRALGEGLIEQLIVRCS